MLLRILTCLTFCAIATATTAAAEFWDTKPFLEWSDKEVEKVLSDSPWATLIAVPLPPSMPMPTAETGAGGRGGGGGDDRSFGPAPRRIRLTISWRSALPLKQAVIRQQAGLRGTLTPDAQAVLTREEDLYVIGVLGLPPQYSRPGPSNMVTAFLHRNGKPPIPAKEAGSQMLRGGSLLLIGFPRTDPITLDDGDVEFDVKFDSLHISKKFKLKELTFGGKLSL